MDEIATSAFHGPFRTDLSIVIGAMREVTAAADERIINQGGSASGDGRLKFLPFSSFGILMIL